MRNRWRSWLVSACLLTAGSAHATGFSIDANVGCEVAQGLGINSLQDTCQEDSGADSFPAAAAPQTAAGSAGIGAGSSSAEARAEFGSLSAGADAACGESPDVFPDASASGRGAATVFDTLHVSSATLEAGTPVTFHVQLNVTSNYSVPANDPSGFFFASAFASLTANSSLSDLELVSNSLDPASDVTSGDFDAEVGASVILQYRADAHPFVTAKGSLGAAQAGVSVRPQITLASPADVTLTADSLHDYAQLAPESRAVEAELAAAAMLLVVARSRTRGADRARRG
jgi:hypothetical protein